MPDDLIDLSLGTWVLVASSLQVENHAQPNDARLLWPVPPFAGLNRPSHRQRELDGLSLSGCSGATCQQSVEDVQIQEIERLNHDISRQMIAVATHADAAHAGLSCSLNASCGIFHNNASVRRSGELRCRGQVHFRIRLSSAHVFSGHDALEIMGCLQSLE